MKLGVAIVRGKFHPWVWECKCFHIIVDLANTYRII